MSATDVRLHRCHCVVVDVDPHNPFEDRCPALVPLDAPFCDECEARHQGEGGLNQYGVAPVGQP